MSDTTTVNKQYFDKEAATYDTRHEKALTQIIANIRDRLDFLGVDWAGDDDSDDDKKQAQGEGKPKRPVRLLDYACGTGTISRALAPYTTQCVGIDLSEGMISAYNTRAENQGLSREEMFAYQGNLCNLDDESPAAFSGPEFYNFDIAAVGLGFHHFDDPRLAARRLVARLRPGGVLMIIEFYAHGKLDTHHPAQHTVKHHGFSEEEMKDVFVQAGAGKDFAVADIGSITLNRPKEGTHETFELKRRLFIARGTKA
ncbi:methyltransferase-like protein [Coniochaeta sp. PMI_546]|nr:methyltransferase-like protein [Coniochaeta sp. PMI_546]